MQIGEGEVIEVPRPIPMRTIRTPMQPIRTPMKPFEFPEKGPPERVPERVPVPVRPIRTPEKVHSHFTVEEIPYSCEACGSPLELIEDLGLACPRHGLVFPL